MAPSAQAAMQFRETIVEAGGEFLPLSEFPCPVRKFLTCGGKADASPYAVSLEKMPHPLVVVLLSKPPILTSPPFRLIFLSEALFANGAETNGLIPRLMMEIKKFIKEGAMLRIVKLSRVAGEDSNGGQKKILPMN